MNIIGLGTNTFSPTVTVCDGITYVSGTIPISSEYGNGISANADGLFCNTGSFTQTVERRITLFNIHNIVPSHETTIAIVTDDVTLFNGRLPSCEVKIKNISGSQINIYGSIDGVKDNVRYLEEDEIIVLEWDKTNFTWWTFN